MVAFVVNHLWQSTLFAAGVALLAHLLRHNAAKLRYALWLTASLKFLIPFALLTALGAHVSLHHGAAAPPPLVVLIDKIAEPLVTPTMSEGVSPSGLVSEATVLTVLAVIWACGALAVFVSWLKRWRRIQRALHASRPVDIQFPTPVRSSTSLLEPGIVGFLRPVLLVPEGIEGRLSADQLRAVLAHELCHVRRRDNLTATFHMVVEALLWFHPIVWWLGARLVAERERACDEEVLRSGTDPEAYAEGILRVCEHYLESPLICAAGVSGSNLKTRIEAIMNHQLAHRLNGPKKVMLAAAAVAAVAVPLVLGLARSSTVHAQPVAAAGQQVSEATPTAQSAAVPQEPAPDAALGNLADALGDPMKFVSDQVQVEGGARGKPWVFSGHVRVSSKKFMFLADRGEMNFAHPGLLILRGTPATFTYTPSSAANIVRGAAEGIAFDSAAREVRLRGNASMSMGDGAVAGERLSYKFP
jgi:beta-lactamase regulating signal transducer with metallopeptidase domain/lipopolysaccharide export system protein LptA